jgi:hypothetical protein
MAREDANTVDAFERALVEVPEVRHADRCSATRTTSSES